MDEPAMSSPSDADRNPDGPGPEGPDTTVPSGPDAEAVVLRPDGVDDQGALDVVVPATAAGQRLDRWLGNHLSPHYSRSYAAALIEDGAITVDASRTKQGTKLRGGERVAGPLGKPASSIPSPEAMDLTILYADEALVVVDKPVGLIIHPGSGNKTGTLINGLLERYPEMAKVGRSDRPGVVHRLDRDTSGVLITARTNEAAQSVVRQFKAKTIRKEYRTVVWGEMPFDEDWIDLPIGNHPRRPQLRAVSHDEGKESSTFYKVLNRFGMASELKVEPRTGRTHQIRVHLDHLGFPVLGDASYGHARQEQWRRWIAARTDKGLRAPVLERQALHCHAMTIHHPVSGEPITFTSPVPADMVDLLEVLKDAQS
jgi:23S rRNA pseudouridine1911/1915/1917 synthase